MNKENKVSKKVIYQAIIDTMNTGECTMDPQVIIDMCQNEIDMLERRYDKARERAAEKKAANDELTTRIENLLTDNYQTVADIVNQLNDENISQQKVVYRLSALAKANIAEKSEVKVPGCEGSKARTVVAYKLA